MKPKKPKSVKKPAGKPKKPASKAPKKGIRVPKEKIAGAFAGMRAEAAGILKNRERFQALLKEALKKAGTTTSEQFGESWEMLMAMLRMCKAYLAGQYEAPLKTIAAIIGTLLYWLNPWDLIPDFIPLAGYIDDLAVVKFSLGFIADDLKKFVRWENKQA